MIEFANAQPQKRLFLELLTRDITLEDAVLDLIDNSINSVLAAGGIRLSEIFDEVISGSYDLGRFKDYLIDITYADGEFALTDNCGGISYSAAKDHVFQFGRASTSGNGDTLSVYGIGLKRALFKLGDKISVVSHFDKSFAVAFLASAWARNPEWCLPMRVLPAGRVRQGTTCIRVKSLSDDTAQRLNDADFSKSLRRRIKETYCFFIGRFCRIRLNGAPVEGDLFDIGSEESLTPSVQKSSDGDVNVIVRADIAPKDRWVTAEAGWYIFCNGRAVVFADRTRLTGWERGLPQFVSKFRGFRGIVFFFSEKPELLPWTTTKTDINEESVVFQRALNMMYTAARPVLRFLSSLYSDDEVEAQPAKAAAEAVRSKPLTQVMSLVPSHFVPPARRAPTTVSVQFKVQVSDINRVKQHLRNPGLSARRIAEIAFKYYLENEVGRPSR